MLKRHLLARFVVAVVLVVALVIFGATSCNTLHPALITTKDSTHTVTTVHHRDTVVMVSADSARIVALVRDVRAARELMEELRRNPRIARGEHNATVTMRVSGDSLIVEGKCDSLAMVLKDAITERNTVTSHNLELERYILEKEKEDNGPGWMKGVNKMLNHVAVLAFLLIVLLVTIAVVLPRIRNLFKRF